ncbi:hypothetical protein [Cardinium endosymbiont of Tipula unca]|uniref:hypothetical protein n=1 Tax=Cardinium endosymbiont of Tipula unca TaxID=3066216 RepID=UPI0030CA7666
MLFCSIKGANRGYIQVLLATSRNRIYFRRRSILYSPLLDDLIAKYFYCFFCKHWLIYRKRIFPGNYLPHNTLSSMVSVYQKI